MLGRAITDELPRLKSDVKAAVEAGKPIQPVLLAAGYRVQKKAQQYSPVVTGTLRRSFHVREARR